MKKSKNREFRDMSSTIKEIGQHYIKNMQLLEQKSGLSISDVTSKKPATTDKRHFVNCVNCAFNQLDGMQEHIIKSEFFACSNYREWWLGLVSRAHFYRLKRESMEQFMYHFSEAFHRVQ